MYCTQDYYIALKTIEFMYLSTNINMYINVLMFYFKVKISTNIQ